MSRRRRSPSHALLRVTAAASIATLICSIHTSRKGARLTAEVAQLSRHARLRTWEIYADAAADMLGHDSRR